MTKTKENLTEARSQAEFQEIEKNPLFVALTHPKFLRGLRAIARHAKNEEIEGGIAVYKTLRGVLVSDLILPTQEDLRDTHGLMMDSVESMMRGYTSVNLFPLTRAEDAQPRRDLLTVIHSHPLHGNSSENHLCPSLGDLNAFENLLSYSPDVTAGILVADRIATDLFLFKKSPGRDFQQYYKRYDEEPSIPTMLKTLNECGINFVTLRISRDEVPYAERVASAITTLNE